MANQTQEVYHCPSCGALVPVPAGEEGDRICAECGYEFRPPVRLSPRSVPRESVSAGGFVQRDVSARRRHSERVEAVVPSDLLPSVESPAEGAEGVRGTKEEVVLDDGRKKVVRRMKKRRRTKLAPLIFLCVWAMVVMLVIILVRNFTRPTLESELDPESLEERKLQAKAWAMRAFIQEHHESCRKVLDEFLACASATTRTQYVRDPDRLAPLMAEYYKDTLAWSLPKDRKLATKLSNLFLRGERKALELVLGVMGPGNVPDKSQPDLEAALVLQGGRWVLEWESFVRYSSDTWTLFSKQLGRPEGEFRVYMRRIKVANQTDEPVITVQFLPPRSDELLWRQDSDWVVVPLNSENGRRIEYIIKEAEREPELGDSIFGRTDPKELYRVRVALSWSEGVSGEKYLKLEEVQAGNWYGPGFEENFEGGAESDPVPAAEGGDSGKEGPDSDGKDRPEGRER